MGEKGRPIRIEIGPRDIESRKVCLQRRDKAPTEKSFMDKEEFIQIAPDILQEIHENMLSRALEFRDANISACNEAAAFDSHWDKENPGWLATPWAGTPGEEEALSKQHKITIRCLPLADAGLPEGLLSDVGDKCFLTGNKANPSLCGGGATRKIVFLYQFRGFAGRSWKCLRSNRASTRC